ncbi:MAG: methionine biosynthesis protein MetW [Candidatus Sumerlaeaceae bacterium]
MRESNKKFIEDWIVAHTPEHARVLDVGCGDGRLLEHLVKEKNARGTGIELDEANVRQAIQRGLSVHHGDAEEGLDHYADDGFDIVIFSLTIQELGHPQRLLREAFRVGRQLVVTFPNFGHWLARWQLAVLGRAPSTPCLPYTWYETPNRHYLTVLDWEEFIKAEGWRVLDRAFVSNGSEVRWLPNLRAEAAMYLLEEG